MMPLRIKQASLAVAALLQVSQAYDMINKGCYTSAGNLVFANTNIYQSYSTCEATCSGQGSTVFAIQYQDCYCGDILPAESDQAPASTCNTGCPGYSQDPCGSKNTAFTVYLTGIDPNVGSLGGSKDHSVSSVPVSSAPPETTTITKPTTVVKPRPRPDGSEHHTTNVRTVLQTVGVGHTVVKTIVSGGDATGAAGSNSSKGGSSTNTVGIAVGVVVGLVVLAAVIGGAVLFMKRRKKNKETSHRRSSSIDSFTTGGGTFKSPSEVSDNRLDPKIMVERRQSGGSVFADNQDYSRRILKVTNPDG